MLVTIGIPAYNRVESLERAIQSAITQSYTNLEIVISNDSQANNKIADIVQKYIALDSRIKYFTRPSPLKTVGNFSFLKDNANGKYFLWIADDDWIDNNYVEECVTFLETHPDYSSASGICSYHTVDSKIIHTHSSFSIEQKSYWKRLYIYFLRVTLNGYFYGVMRTDLAKQFKLPDQLGFDWSLIAYFCFKGKIKVLKNTNSHISKGGMSNEGTGLASYFSKSNFLSKNLIGLATSINCSCNIFSSKLYNISFLKKLLLSCVVFISSYCNTIRWDIVLTKRRIVKFLKIDSEGIIIKAK